MALASNSQGFLTGERIVDSIDLVGKDTAEILALMKRGYKRSIRDAFAARYAPSNQVTNDIDGSGRDTLPRLDAGVRNTNPLGNGSRTREIDTAARVRRADVLREAGEPATRQRDVNGRFSGASNEQGQNQSEDDKNRPESERNKSDSKFQKALTAIAVRIHAPDAQGVDPTIDALKEAGVFKAIGVVAGAGSWMFSFFKNRDKDKKKKDDKPKEQSQFSWFGAIFGSLIGKVVTAALATAAGSWVGDKAREALGMNDDDSKLNEVVGRATAGLAATMGDKEAQELIDTQDNYNIKQGGWAGAESGASKRLSKGGLKNLFLPLGIYNAVAGAWDGYHGEGGDGSTSLADVGGSKKTKYDKVMQEEWSKLGFSGADMVKLKAQSLAENRTQDPNVSSPVGAFGNTQFMPPTAKQYGVLRGDSPEVVASQYRGQGKYMKYLLKRYDGDWDKARAGYNAGEGNVDKAIKRGAKNNDSWKNHLPKPSETLPYLDRINRLIPTIGLPASANIRDAKTQVGSQVPQTAPSPKQPPIPAPPKTQTQVSSRTPVQQAAPQVSDAISQNLADRNLAHAVTGGIGMDRWVG